MKILMIAPTIYKLKEKYDSYGGIEPMIGNLAIELAKLGNEVIVAAPKGSYLGEKVKIIETVESNINYNYNLEKEATQILIEYIKTNNLNPKDFAIHDHTHQKFIYLHKAQNPELKVCSTLHNQCNFQNSPPGIPHMNLICISNSHMAETSGILGIHAEVAYNGINLDNYIYNENKSDYFLFLSRISRFKGAHEAIQACKESGNKLLVAGEDVFVNDPSYVMSIMNSCNEKNIKYLGNITEEKKRELLSNAKALVLPLLWNEPFGLVAIESLASGTPVITSPRGAMPEIITHRKDGLFCYNIGEIKSAMKMIDELKSKDCREKAEQFSIQKMTERYLELYKRILSGNEW
jgi:glycosyltransferase involved in cell wall biosynthesis